MIGCDCRVCRSADPRDRRTRPSILFEIVDRVSSSEFALSVRNVLVDTSTDLRAQALANEVRRVDAILFTHSHADHVMGLDEVRRFNALQKGPIACYGDAQTLEDLRRTFAYVFDPEGVPSGGIPQLRLFSVAGPFSLGGIEFAPIPLVHGRRTILGYRVGGFAYLTDCNRIPDEAWPLLQGVRTLVLDALRDRPHPTHFSVAEALEVVERLAPERAYFTHICHELSHAETCARLPAGVELAYDGLVLNV
jgi:phosphoribosyl 1,2-cyclic phosphate phosphodiesterase